MFKLFYLIIYIQLFACMHARMCLVPAESREGIGSSRTIVTDACEVPCGCWEWSLGPLVGKPALLVARPSLWLTHPLSKCVIIIKGERPLTYGYFWAIGFTELEDRSGVSRGLEGFREKSSCFMSTEFQLFKKTVVLWMGGVWSK